MKNKNSLAKKLEIFYQQIDSKRKQIASEDKMRLQTDLEFNQNKIKQLNKRYDVTMFITRIREGKIYATEQLQLKD